MRRLMIPLLVLLLLGPAAVGRAQDCPEGLTDCAGYCADLLRDEQNCGECGRNCPDGYLCVNGQCELVCPAGLINCNGICVDQDNDRRNCGECGRVCPPGEICVYGACQVSCPIYLWECGGQCVDVYNDPRNCGECGRVCPDGHGCADGQCVSCESPVSVIDVQMSPRPVRLDPNAPNPFNPRTRIRFWLRDTGVVSVGVYDLSGRLVRRLVVDRLYAAGANEVTWDGRGDDGRAVASGVYVCRVRAGGEEASGRMTVLK